ncbi:tRNA preQ1(34) S-adenosylmethionine ribosyltransferase-isomerase QueA [Candidatus Peregrinibacteria bacterium]|jgi:S-adenosylmethionine:tRNA ribosyltransferase-isomerase|nr:tRNA preQ1(34) S-adenosylmethionine ribosyltransferase-isomerase QueA [Candidatus Peregrinibacteria bacterium]MBT7483623.1 tRNA preQ1(34) S-adenosylmethionine ribosyltransferase-isomerase QueA [Candidatus Peregrinibacteria bacterium]MBT7702659.1 tRNA preQ1(34) S-adenosylmethionine ribosyltransferase-isomerase QueA [Candidatus Peregrinibacteria bacterium]
MKTAAFDYHLPEELIAQNPLPNRDQSKLMVLNRANQEIEHRHVYELTQILGPNDVLVFNETQVFPARLHGKIKDKSVEILLHRELKEGAWECLVKPGKRFKQNSIIKFSELTAIVKKINEDGSRILEFSTTGPTLNKIIDQIGETPLPPYIKHSQASPEQYQTTYAKNRGSVAAPTAGLHFTPELLAKLAKQGVEQHFVTLHVGRGTFEPVKADKIEDHKMHAEWFTLSKETVTALNAAKKANKRIIAVGTTTNRVLESCATAGHLTANSTDTELFITPGYKFQFVDALLTNFHLPKSTLLMLVSALADKELIDRAYQEAINQKYRFFSFGDAMLIL